MIALAWSFFMVLSMFFASSQAFITAPVPGYPHGLTTYSTTSTFDPSTEKSPALNSEAAAAAIGPLSQEDDDVEEEENDDRENYAGAAGALPSGPSGAGRRSEEQAVYVIEFETEADGKGEDYYHLDDDRDHSAGSKDLSDDDGSDGQSPLDPWSIVWYIGSFGGLVAFFLIVSCSEWCCRRGARPLSVPYTQRGEVINTAGGVQSADTETPPPPYHLFAPPPYDSVNYAEIADKCATTGEKLDIYVITVPIHQPPQQQQQQLDQQQQPPPA